MYTYISVYTYIYIYTPIHTVHKVQAMANALTRKHSNENLDVLTGHTGAHTYTHYDGSGKSGVHEGVHERERDSARRAGAIAPFNLSQPSPSPLFTSRPYDQTDQDNRDMRDRDMRDEDSERTHNGSDIFNSDTFKHSPTSFTSHARGGKSDFSTNVLPHTVGSGWQFHAEDVLSPLSPVSPHTHLKLHRPSVGQSMQETEEEKRFYVSMCVYVYV